MSLLVRCNFGLSELTSSRSAAVCAGPFNRPRIKLRPTTEVLGVAQVWVTAEVDGSGGLRLSADSDSELTRGLAAVLVRCLSGLTPDQLLQVRLAHPVARRFCSPLQRVSWAVKAELGGGWCPAGLPDGLSDSFGEPVRLIW